MTQVDEKCPYKVADLSLADWGRKVSNFIRATAIFGGALAARLPLVPRYVSARV